MKPRILLINPPIYDFSAYDFWLKPYGLLRAAGFLRGKADFALFDFLDRFDPRGPPGTYPGFRNVYLGFESRAYAWQKKTGGKVYSNELARAIANLAAADADLSYPHAYLIVGHPDSEAQTIEESMLMAHTLGIRVMLSEFSPIPGTPDGEQCRRWIDLDEPLWHNKTAFTLRRLGGAEVERLKRLATELNQGLLNVERMSTPQAGFHYENDTFKAGPVV